MNVTYLDLTYVNLTYWNLTYLNLSSMDLTYYMNLTYYVNSTYYMNLKPHRKAIDLWPSCIGLRQPGGCVSLMSVQVRFSRGERSEAPLVRGFSTDFAHLDSANLA